MHFYGKESVGFTRLSERSIAQKMVKNPWPRLIEEHHGKPLGVYWDLNSNEQLRADN
jgi:hypothetical protein